MLILFKLALSDDTRMRSDELLSNEIDSTCPTMTLSGSGCEAFGYAVFDGDRSCISYGMFHGTDYSSCYNPTECYIMQFISYSDSCVYHVNLDGVVISDTFDYDPSLVANETLFVGNCTNEFEGDQQLRVPTHPHLSDMLNHVFYRVGQKPERGII